MAKWLKSSASKVQCHFSTPCTQNIVFNINFQKTIDLNYFVCLWHTKSIHHFKTKRRVFTFMHSRGTYWAGGIGWSILWCSCRCVNEVKPKLIDAKIIQPNWMHVQHIEHMKLRIELTSVLDELFITITQAFMLSWPSCSIRLRIDTNKPSS